MEDDRPVILDLFCGAGGAAMGYHRAGFRVIGVDIESQPNYPFTFYRGDAIEVGEKLLREFPVAAIHASPPCQAHTTLGALARRPGAKRTHGHVNMIPDTWHMASESGLPYVIENVPGAPLLWPITLCGSMFGLFVRRHRLFQIGRFPRITPPPCDHKGQAERSPGFPQKRYHSGKPVQYIRSTVAVYGRGSGGGVGELATWRKAMGIDWMNRYELTQSIPPAYTEYIGKKIMESIGG